MAWLDHLARAAPTAVEAFRAFEAGRRIGVRQVVRRAGGAGSSDRSLAELAATARALRDIVASLPARAFDAPGGEEDWSVAQALGHVATSRAGLVLAASLAAAGRWPADAPTVVPGIPGPADVSRETVVERIAKSQRVLERSARAVAGHELDPCPLDHPLVGRLRCGEWLVFAAVHDVMHLAQLHRLAAGDGAAT